VQLSKLSQWPEFNGGKAPSLNFGACSGAKMQDMLNKQLNPGPWKDFEYHNFGYPQLAVLTISGNDADFFR
jgi:hypothetical protein